MADPSDWGVGCSVVDRITICVKEMMFGVFSDAALPFDSQLKVFPPCHALLLTVANQDFPAHYTHTAPITQLFGSATRSSPSCLDCIRFVNIPKYIKLAHPVIF